MSLFGAEKIPLDNLKAIEHQFPDYIVWAVPVMIFFTGVEMIISWWQDKKYYEKKETIGSVGVGLGNLFVSAAMKFVLLFLVTWIYNIVPWRMELAWWTLIPCYIIYDFYSYWAHRISHEQRFWWTTHVPHHSGEHYNLAVSFRLSWIQHLKIVFFLPVVLMGFHPVIFFVCHQLAVLFQFWVHTEYIRKMPRVIEYIFATPSNHRVHHGSQEQYIDKNYGATFIIWDRMFGTFVPEGEKVIYGLTNNIDNKANPVYINFHEFFDMINDVRNAKTWKERLFFLFGSPIKVAEVRKARLQKPEAIEETQSA